MLIFFSDFIQVFVCTTLKRMVIRVAVVTYVVLVRQNHRNNYLSNNDTSGVELYNENNMLN